MTDTAVLGLIVKLESAAPPCHYFERTAPHMHPKPQCRWTPIFDGLCHAHATRHYGEATWIRLWNAGIDELTPAERERLMATARSA